MKRYINKHISVNANLKIMRLLAILVRTLNYQSVLAAGVPAVNGFYLEKLEVLPLHLGKTDRLNLVMVCWLFHKIISLSVVFTDKVIQFV